MAFVVAMPDSNRRRGSRGGGTPPWRKLHETEGFVSATTDGSEQ